MQRTFFKYVSLNILGALGLSGYILADTFFVANRLGTDGLAALNLAISVFGLINGLGMLLGIGGATRYSICRFQEDEARANRAFTRAVGCGALLGLALALIGLLLAGPLAGMLGAEGATLPMCTVYLRTAMLFAPCFILNHILIAFVRNDGNPKLAMAAMLTGSLANIVLDYVFLYPLNLGIFGAALATGVAPVIGLTLSSLHILTGRNRFRLCPCTPRPAALADLAGLGSAAFINECSSGVVLVVYNLLMMHLSGTIGVAAYGIVANLALMALALFTGISQGCQPLLSQAYGRGEQQQVHLLSRLALGTAGFSGCALAILALVAAPGLTALFNADGGVQLQQMAETGLRLYFLGFPLAGLNLITAALFGATERARACFLLSLFRGGIGIVLVVLLFALLFGQIGVWLAFPATEGLALLLSLVLYRQNRALPAQAVASKS